MAVLSELFYRLNAISLKIQQAIFIETGKLTLKFNGNPKDLEEAKNFEKEHYGGLNTAWFQDFKVTAIKVAL